MESIDRWLKSLRLHKYTPLFKRLTYNEMLNLDEQFLVERDITKGARNKILVSVKRLNLRQDQLINMMDDLDQDNISMKEALNVLKEMLITPIPYPPNHDNPILPPTPPSTTRSASSAGSSTTEGIDTDDHSSTTSNSGSSSSSSSSAGSTSAMSATSTATNESPSLFSAPQTTQSFDNINCTTLLPTSTSSNNYHTDPHELTHLFVDTFSKVAQRLIESIAGSEDSACHGIMAAIVDECLNHNSFTKGQKAVVARFRQHQITKEQKPRAVGYKHYQLQQQQQHQQQQQQQLSLRQYYQNQLQHQQVQYQRAVNIHTYGSSGNRHYQQQTSYTHNPHSNQFHHHHQQQQHHHINHHHQQVNHLPPHQIILPNHLSAHRNKQLLQKQQQEQHQQHHYQQPSQRNNHKTAVGAGCGVGGGGSSTNVVVDHWNGGGPYNRQQFSVSPSSLSISTMGSLSTASNSDEEERTPLTDSYREYSLLGPGLTFELPFLRAKVAATAATSVQ